MKNSNAIGRLTPNVALVLMGVITLAMGMTQPVQAQIFETLYNFDGSSPGSALVQAVDGYLYGTTWDGGANSAGTVFRITTSGKLKTLYNFCSQPNCVDGSYPHTALIQATNGDFYGTTTSGGTGGAGTVFEITPGGTLTTLYSFCTQPSCADGGPPGTALVRAADGNFYGTTAGGGTGCFQDTCGSFGTAFKITPSGTLTTLHEFCSEPNCADGYDAQTLIQATDGNLYGVTAGVIGAYQYGTVFKIPTSGALTTIYSFCPELNEFDCTDGYSPQAALVQATNGNLYGATWGGGVISNPPCGGEGCGTVFQVTLSGALTTLYSFCSQISCPDGARPQAALVQGTDGNLYGTTNMGGAYEFGTIFDITLRGALKTLYSFCTQPSCADGEYPITAVMQGTNGTFYGTTDGGGGHGYGNVYSLGMGLGPFVRTLPAAGKVGAEVGILGTKLTGATGVTFNGAQAKFTVRLPSLILTHVPAGATTGKIEVTLPGGTLKSNVPFYVLK